MGRRRPELEPLPRAAMPEVWTPSAGQIVFALMAVTSIVTWGFGVKRDAASELEMVAYGVVACLVFILIKSFYGTFVKWRQHVAVQEMRRKAGPAEKEN